MYKSIDLFAGCERAHIQLAAKAAAAG